MTLPDFRASSAAEMGQSRPFRMEEISHYDERGGAVLEQSVLLAKHPAAFRRAIHWVSGRDLPQLFNGQIPVNDLISPAVGRLLEGIRCRRRLLLGSRSSRRGKQNTETSHRAAGY